MRLFCVCRMKIETLFLFHRFAFFSVKEKKTSSHRLDSLFRSIFVFSSLGYGYCLYFSTRLLFFFCRFFFCWFGWWCVLLWVFSLADVINWQWKIALLFHSLLYLYSENVNFFNGLSLCVVLQLNDNSENGKQAEWNNVLAQNWCFCICFRYQRCAYHFNRSKVLNQSFIFIIMLFHLCRCMLAVCSFHIALTFKTTRKKCIYVRLPYLLCCTYLWTRHKTKRDQ